MKTKRLPLLAAALLAGVTLPATAQTVLSDTFETGMDGWVAWDGSVTGYATVADPLVPANTVLSTPPTGRTVTIRKNTDTVLNDSMVLSFDLYSGNAGDNSWNLSAALLTGLGSAVPGYGFSITPTTATLYKYPQGWSTLNGSGAVSLGSASLDSGPLAGIWKTDAWNSLSLQWLKDGSFSLTINGTVVATGTDATYNISAARLVYKSFCTNDAGAGVTGRVLLMDNVQISAVAPIPEPATVAAILSAAVFLIGAGCRQRNSRRFR
ncbi:hypothetical protein OpiT1DRAFT_02338 [Opitutaceae bacterium TAV1]|nr:hypothetical protein OpiT1DRAFT_02338 [Opitutaceae bacterium TAV1]